MAGGESEQPIQKTRPRVVLALGGGGIRGAAHVGVLRVLQREGVPIDAVVGISMGAVIGGLYCAGVPLDKIERELEDLSLQKNYAPACIAGAICVPFIKLKSICGSRSLPYAGLVSCARFRKFINKQLPAGAKRIENLHTPSFCAVATNLLDGKLYRLTTGDVSEAIAASAAIPPIMRPVQIGGGLFIDGGLRCNLPIEAAREYGDIVIAVSADEELNKLDASEFTSYKTLTNRLTSIMSDAADERILEKADVAIEPAVTGIPFLSKNKADVKNAVRAGERAAEEAVPAIKTLLTDTVLTTEQRSPIPISGRAGQSHFSRVIPVN